MSTILKGAVLGLANVVAVGLALGVVYSGHGMLAMLPVVLLFGTVPGLLAGAVIGALAGVSRTTMRARKLTLVLAALAAAVAITAMFGVLELAPVACIPTVFAALALERWTAR
jgi:hypothetical protein